MAYVFRFPTPERRTKTSQKRVYAEIYSDPRWTTLRDHKFRQNPVCEECEKNGRTSITREVHHIIRFADGLDKQEREKLAFSKYNIKSLCIACHKEAHKNYTQDKLLRKLILGY